MEIIVYIVLQERIARSESFSNNISPIEFCSKHPIIPWNLYVDMLKINMESSRANEKVRYGIGLCVWQGFLSSSNILPILDLKVNAMAHTVVDCPLICLSICAAPNEKLTMSFCSLNSKHFRAPSCTDEK